MYKPSRENFESVLARALGARIASMGLTICVPSVMSPQIIWLGELGGMLCHELFRANRSCSSPSGLSWDLPLAVAEVIRHDLCVLLYYIEKSHLFLTPRGCSLSLALGAASVIAA